MFGVNIAMEIIILDEKNSGCLISGPDINLTSCCKCYFLINNGSNLYVYCEWSCLKNHPKMITVIKYSSPQFEAIKCTLAHCLG